MLCACRSGPLWLKWVILALAMLLFLAGWSPGIDPGVSSSGPGISRTPPKLERSGDIEEWTSLESTRPLVRQSLSHGAILLALGTEMELDEHRAFVEMLPVWEFMGSHQMVREELQVLRSSLQKELHRLLPDQTEELLTALSEDRLVASLNQAVASGKPCSFALEAFRVEVGFATYRHWQVRVRKPALEENPMTLGQVERLLGLPSTYQSYVRLLLRDPPRMKP